MGLSRLPRRITLLPRLLPTLLHLLLLLLPPSLLPLLPTSSTRGRPLAPLPSLVPVPSASVLEASRPQATGAVDMATTRGLLSPATATGVTATAGGTAAMATATG